MLESNDNVNAAMFSDIFNRYKRLTKKLHKQRKYVKNTSKPNIWTKYVFTPKPNTEMLATSVLKPVSPTDPKRKFKGSTTHAFGPVNAQAMSMGASSPISDAGFGIGAFGLTPFGEGMAKHASVMFNFISELNESDDLVVNTIVDGYRQIYNAFDRNSTIVMMGIQPSFREQIDNSIDMELMVDAINTFTGKIISVYSGIGHGMEPIDIVKKWYVDIGIQPQIVEDITFIEKTNDLDQRVTELPGLVTSPSNEWMTPIVNSKNVVLVGCTDPYFIGDAMHNLIKNNRKYVVDVRYIYFLR